VTVAGRFAEATKGGRLLVKICGITTPEDAQQAVSAGADAVGFVFWFMSPRKVDPARAAAIARGLPASVLRVGVFVDAPRDEMSRIADAVGLDLLQLHGEEPIEAFADLPRPALKAVRVGKGFAPEEALRYAGRVAGVVVDTHVARLSHRLGLSIRSAPEKIERALQRLIPQPQWTLFSHLLIWHGRRRCFARNPDCTGCELKTLCPSAGRIRDR
jgi:phosphoribosylanthranilate isomerase